MCPMHIQSPPSGGMAKKGIIVLSWWICSAPLCRTFFSRMMARSALRRSWWSLINSSLVSSTSIVNYIFTGGSSLITFVLAFKTSEKSTWLIWLLESGTWIPNWNGIYITWRTGGASQTPIGVLSTCQKELGLPEETTWNHWDICLWYVSAYKQRDVHDKLHSYWRKAHVVFPKRFFDMAWWVWSARQGIYK